MPARRVRILYCTQLTLSTTLPSLHSPLSLTLYVVLLQLPRDKLGGGSFREADLESLDGYSSLFSQFSQFVEKELQLHQHQLFPVVSAA